MIKGNGVLTINGERVEGIREVTFTESRPVLVLSGGAHGGGKSTSMRQALALHVQKEVALERWRNFNEVHGYGRPDGDCLWARVRRLRNPKPTPKQYRLKRRAAGAKRRMRVR